MTCSTTECGTGIGSVILPGDPSSDSIVTALPVFGGVEVTWTVPSTNPFAVAYVKVWRSQTNSFNAAMQVAASGGDRFFDRIDFANGIFSTQYYWIQFVSINGTVSEPAGPAAALPRATIEQLLDQLTAKIDYNSLSVEMKTTVDKADAYKLAQDLTNGTLAGEQASIRDALALVQEGMDEAFVLISNEVTARQSAGQAFADSLNTLAVSTGESFATVQQDLQAVIDDTSNIVGSIYTVKLTANGLVGGFGLTNDSETVEAGFDVDTFWVGRTQADKVKPFIIENGEVFIDQAVIQNASIDFAKINTATFESLSAITQRVGQISMQRDPNEASFIRFGKTSASDASNVGFWIGIDSNGDPGVNIGGANGIFKFTPATGIQIAGSYTSIASPGTSVFSSGVAGTYTWTNNTALFTRFRVRAIGGGGGGAGISTNSPSGGYSGTATIVQGPGMVTVTGPAGGGGSSALYTFDYPQRNYASPTILSTIDGFGGIAGVYVSSYTRHGGSGGAGTYVSQDITIPLGTTVTITVGAGGNGGYGSTMSGEKGGSGAVDIMILS